MSKKVLIGVSILGILIVVAGAAYILRPSAEASAPIEAIPVDVEQLSAEEPENPVIETESEGDTHAELAAEENAGSESTQEVDSFADQSVGDVEPLSSDGVIVFSIVQAESQVRFTLGELLSGVPTTVIGVTDQVAGEIAINPADPANANVGVILVNARTFKTDSDFRNRAINNSILETGKYEFVTFTPVEIKDFPDDPQVGDALKFQLVGDLTVRDITQPITFDVNVTVVSETRLEGSAAAVLNRADFNLQIPEVPRVADVDEEVLLEIDFIAVAE